MSLSSAALLPHSPLLIPEIGQANYKLLDKTISAYQEVGRNIKNKNTDTLIITSPHGAMQPDSFTLDIAPEMNIDLKDFGFIPPKTTLTGNIVLADKIVSSLRPDFPLQLSSTEALDQGSAIPIYTLREFLDQIKIIVLSSADNLSLEEHIKLGRRLRTVIDNETDNISIIASGDLSHRLQKKSPGGYSPKGTKFDNKLIEYLSNSQTALDNISKMDQKLIRDAKECALKPLLILLGILGEQPWQADVLNYQTDFGVGYLSLNFQI